MAHRKTVVAAVILSNLLVTLGFCLVNGFTWRLLGYNLMTNAPYLLVLAAIGWAPGRRTTLGALAITAASSLLYEPLIRAVGRVFG